jgi:hypothetical protein
MVPGPRPAIPSRPGPCAPPRLVAPSSHLSLGQLPSRQSVDVCHQILSAEAALLERGTDALGPVNALSLSPGVEHARPAGRDDFRPSVPES